MVRKVVSMRPAKRTVDTNLDSVEEDTLKRVEHTMLSLGSFLSRWDASRTKDNDLFPQVAKIRTFYQQLAAWQKEAVRARGKGGRDAQIKRLRGFVVLCRTYA